METTKIHALGRRMTQHKTDRNYWRYKEYSTTNIDLNLRLQPHPCICLVFCKQEVCIRAVRPNIDHKCKPSECLVPTLHRVSGCLYHTGLPRAALVLTAPDPRVPEPERGQHVKACRVRSAVHYGNVDKNVVWRIFRVLRKHVPVTIFVEHSLRKNKDVQI